VKAARTDLLQNILVQEPFTPITRKESNVRNPDRIGLTHHEITPANRFDDNPRPSTKKLNLVVAQSLPAYDVNHYRVLVRSPYVVENVSPRQTLHLCGQLERLSRDPLNTGIKVGSNEICEFQARFVNDMVTKRR
jgi:hypothetical protein